MANAHALDHVTLRVELWVSTRPERRAAFEGSEHSRRGSSGSCPGRPPRLPPAALGKRRTSDSRSLLRQPFDAVPSHSPCLLAPNGKAVEPAPPQFKISKRSGAKTVLSDPEDG